MRNRIERIEREAVAVEEELRDGGVADAPVQVEKTSLRGLQGELHAEADGSAGCKYCDAPAVRSGHQAADGGRHALAESGPGLDSFGLGAAEPGQHRGL